MSLPIRYERQKTLRHVSPSQIKTFARCKRRWFFEKLVGLRTPPTPALIRGSALHACVEHRIMHGSYDGKPDIVRMANVGEDHLALLAHGYAEGTVLVEEKIRLDEENNWSPSPALPLIGRADVVDLANNMVIDHKTTSNWRYCLSPEKLKNDPQAVSYLTWAYISFNISTPCSFRHLYYRTRGKPAVRETTVAFSKSELFERYGRLCETTEDMATLAEHQHAADVPGNRLACNDYGGCPFKAHCHGLGDVFSDAKSQELMMNFKEKIAARRLQQSQSVTKSPNPPDGEPLDEKVDPPAPKKKRKPKAKAKPVSTPTLYIGCLPHKVEVTYLADLLKPLQQQVAEMNSLTHYGLLEYGKGKTMVVALLAESMTADKLPEHLVADRRNPCTDACLEVLAPLFGRVVERLG